MLISALHAEREQAELRALIVPPEEEPDSVTRGLRAQEMRLRANLLEASDSSVARQQELHLAEVLYRLATRTHDSRDVRRALVLWRPAYDRIAAALGDSTARARMTELERFVR